MRAKRESRWLNTLAKGRRRTEIRTARPTPISPPPSDESAFTIPADASTTVTTALIAHPADSRDRAGSEGRALECNIRYERVERQGRRRHWRRIRNRTGDREAICRRGHNCSRG